MIKDSIGLFFGSFNPVHQGHLEIGKKIFKKKSPPLKEIWYILSPQNPFKEKNTLINFCQRLKILKMFLKNYSYLKASTIEEKLPKPNFSVTTLKLLKNSHPEKKFYIIMGEDNLKDLAKWQELEWIFKHFPIIIYPRKVDFISSLIIKNFKKNFSVKFYLLKEEIFNLSSSEIRGKLKKEKNSLYEQTLI